MELAHHKVIQEIYSILLPLAYARVDGVEEDGRLLLMEFELIEPYLFLGERAGAAERFVESVIHL